MIKELIICLVFLKLSCSLGIFELFVPFEQKFLDIHAHNRLKSLGLRFLASWYFINKSLSISTHYRTIDTFARGLIFLLKSRMSLLDRTHESKKKEMHPNYFIGSSLLSNPVKFEELMLQISGFLMYCLIVQLKN